MKMQNSIIYKDKEYSLLLWEGEVFEPASFGITPVWPESYDLKSFFTCLVNKERELSLISFTVNADGNYPVINNLLPSEFEVENVKYKKYEHLYQELPYSGAIVIGNDKIDSFEIENNIPCYAYRDVVELIFNEGILVTTIDHRKGMHRIRKNIETGLRNIHRRKDEKCIRGFLKHTFVGEYNVSSFAKIRRKMLNEINLIKKIKKKK